MTTNGEWLDYLAQNAPDELAAWFDAEHTESPTSDTMRHIGQVIENTIKRGVYGDTEPENADSRERLEADAFAYLQTAYITYPQIIELLDRQAAITKKACAYFWQEIAEDRDRAQMKCDELTAERDNLKDDLINERGKLNRKMNALREVTRDYRNERDHYRSKFGKCIDYADAIHALMDDEGMA